jgi:hypothetical protein
MTSTKANPAGQGGVLKHFDRRNVSAHKLSQQQRQAAKLTHKQQAALGTLSNRPVTLPRVAFLERPEIDGGLASLAVPS